MSLIELLISIAMIGGLIVLYSSLFNVSVMTKRMRNENLAYHIASKKMEELRSTPFASLPTSGPFTDPQMNQLPAASASYIQDPYSTYSGMLEVVVTVSWNDGRARNVTLRTVMGTGGINP